MAFSGVLPKRFRLNCAAALLMLLAIRVVAQQALTSPPAPSHLRWQGPGGRHEFGVWWGYSGFSGDIWGAAHNVSYMPIGVRYSYEFYRHNQAWALRYSPEITPYARISWLQPDPVTNVVSNDSPRLHSSGGGASPFGFRAVFSPMSSVQPFFSGNGGFIYFRDRVLSAQGSQFMYTIDFGAGVNIYEGRRQAVTIGYRYQHLSNANISFHNPGTDANTFYFGVSRFRNRGE